MEQAAIFWYVREGQKEILKGMEKVKASSLITSQHPDYSPRNLKAMRKALGLTQMELAERAGVMQSEISRFESESDRSTSPKLSASIANVLVKAEFDRVRQSGATPKPKVQKLNERIKYLEKELFVAQNGLKQLEKTNAELLSMNKELLSLHGWKIRNVVEDDSQREAEQKLMAKIGAEKLPSVEEDALRSEIEQHGKPEGNV